MLQVEIVGTAEEAVDIRSFELARPDGAPLPPVAAGAHVDVHLRPDLIRQYSLLNGPEDRRYLIAVKREPQSRGGSRAMHELRVGDILTIGEPRNQFPLDEQAERHLLLAAGIGITPLLSMARHLGAKGQPFVLHYFTRSAAHVAFSGLLARLQHTSGEVTVHTGIQPEALGSCLAPLLATRAAGEHLYMCGPVPFMAAVAAHAEGAWPAEAVHREYFSAPAGVGTAGGEGAFSVRLARTNLACRVQAGETIVQALERAGIAVPVSCEQGICGTCLTSVIAGIPDHRDAFLNDDERTGGKLILPCVSRSCSDELVLDL